jgi:hypothetical protein
LLPLLGRDDDEERLALAGGGVRGGPGTGSLEGAAAGFCQGGSTASGSTGSGISSRGGGSGAPAS